MGPRPTVLRCRSLHDTHVSRKMGCRTLSCSAGISESAGRQCLENNGLQDKCPAQQESAGHQCVGKNGLQDTVLRCRNLQDANVSKQWAAVQKFKRMKGWCELWRRTTALYVGLIPTQGGHRLRIACCHLSRVQFSIGSLWYRKSPPLKSPQRKNV